MSHFLNRRDDKVFSSTLKSAQQRGDICHVRACNTDASQGHSIKGRHQT